MDRQSEESTVKARQERVSDSHNIPIPTTPIPSGLGEVCLFSSSESREP